MARDVDLREFEELTENQELRGQITKLQGELRRARTKTADLVGAVRQGAKDAAIVLGNPPEVPAAPKDRRTTIKPEVALLHLSDLHFGKKTDTFDMAVAAERVRRLTEKVVHLTDIERADHPVRVCHVMLGGDFIENVHIFPGQPFEVDGSLFAHMMQAKGATVELLRTLLANFESVVVWEEPGNHGRLGRKGDHPAEDSADLLVYRMVRDQLAEHEGRTLVWNETQGWHSIVEIGQYRALLVHGDEVRSFGGQTPAFGIAKKVNAWATGVVAPFTDCYMGHWHQPLVIPLAHGRGRVFVNPSIESDSVYAQEFVGSTGTPGQRLNFINPQDGRVTTERVVWLD